MTLRPYPAQSDQWVTEDDRSITWHRRIALPLLNGIDLQKSPPVDLALDTATPKTRRTKPGIPPGGILVDA